MKKINFTKMVASGNDFIVISSGSSLSQLAKSMCDRIYGAGADGLLVIEKSKKADVRMRIFNADGSEAEMCGNGARCAALYLGKRKGSLETKAGIIKTETSKDSVRIKLTDPKNIKLDIPLAMGARILRVNFINTGVPHCVVFVEGLDKIDIVGLGREIRYHEKFSPRGTNVDFVELLSGNFIRIRTYERGVEDETLACGTGATASAIISAIKMNKAGNAKISVLTQGEEILKVYFHKEGSIVKDTWLEGKAKIVYEGVYNV